jgi:hypothetical protein
MRHFSSTCLGVKTQLPLDGHDLPPGPLSPLPHLLHEELSELAAAIEHRTRGSVHELHVGDFGHASLERAFALLVGDVH